MTAQYFLSLFEFSLTPEIQWVKATSRADEPPPDPNIDVAFIFSPEQNRLYVTNGYHGTILRKVDIMPKSVPNIYGRSYKGKVDVYAKVIPIPMMVALRQVFGREARIAPLLQHTYDAELTTSLFKFRGN